MRNNIKLNYKEGWGDQKCIFWSPNKVVYGEEKKRKEKKGRRRIGRRRSSQGMDACLWYGTCDFYMELYGFVWISCLIVWLGACSKPRVVKITS